MSNAYQVGIGGFVTVSLYVIILAFLWRAAAAKLSNSNRPSLSGIGAAMGATL
jgi:hypothetical protein